MISTVGNDNTRKFNVVWQIWEPGVNIREDFSHIDARFEIKCRGDVSYRTCGQEFKEEADVFVAQAYYPDADDSSVPVYLNWEDVPYGNGYGIRAISPDDTCEMISALFSTDWMRHSTISTHNARHTGITEIKRILSEAFPSVD